MEATLQQIAKRTKEDVIAQKIYLEEHLRHLERKDIENALRELLPAIHDMHHSIAHMQNNLNLLYKRTQQITEEMENILKK